MNVENELNNIKNEAYTLYKRIRDLEKLATAVEGVSLSEIDRLRIAIESENFVVLDVETTGIRDGEIIEISIIDHKGDVLLVRRLSPHGDVPEETTAVHGLTKASLENEKPFEDIVVEIKGHLAGKDVLVYNATFDRKFLHKSAEASGIDKINWKAFSNWICVMTAYRDIHGGKFNKLTNSAEKYGVSVKNELKPLDEFKSLTDCLLTLELSKEMVKISEPTTD